MIPKKFLQRITNHFGITDNESEVVSRAISGESLDKIAEELGITRDALQKRLGEVYKKFQILGFGPGKLAKLQQRLMEEYQKYRQNPKEDELEETLINEVSLSTEKPTFELSQLSDQEKQLLYVALLNEEALSLNKIQSEVFPNTNLGKVLIIVGEMLKKGLLKEENQTNIILMPDNNFYLKEELNNRMMMMIRENNIDSFSVLDLWKKLGFVSDKDNLPSQSCLYQNLAEYCHQQGNQFYLLGELNTAKNYLLIALKFNENWWQSYYKLGLITENLQDWQTALNYYQKALKYDENKTYQPLIDLTHVMILQGEIFKAKEIILESIEIIENEQVKANLSSHLGWIYFLEKDYLNAESYIKKAIKLEPNSLMANYLMAEILETNKKEKEALIFWLNCLEIDQENRWNSPIVMYAKFQAKLRINQK